MKKKTVMLVSLFIGVCLISLPILDKSALAEEKTGITLEETTVQDALKRTLKEKAVLLRENSVLKSEIDKLNSRINIYLSRIKELSGKTVSLQKELSRLKDSSMKDKEEMKASLSDTIQKLTQENQQLKDFLSSVQEEREDNQYFMLWQKAETTLQAAKEKVKDLSQKYEDLKGDTGKVHYNLGNFFFKSGQYEQALSEYKIALRYLPNDTDICYNLAVIYDYYIKDAEKAKFYYSKYLGKTPRSKDSLAVKSRLIENDFKSKLVE